ncbi:MAG: RsmB/NOP family class I SAM-dependent RNA methyltransferase [Candidatus Aramenus sp.]|nr:RsmB/NOP family class I SAM-dependent RNA methyltransferase [Candidatus Aramenus sp.]
MGTIEDYISRYKDLFRYSVTAKARFLARKYGFLDYMVERYIDMFKDEAMEFLESCSFPLRKSIRCNTLKVECEELVERLEGKGFALEKVDWLKFGYVVKAQPPKPSLGSTLEYMLGYYYIQGLASMVPAEILDPKEGDVVLDMASSPGGKTTQMSQLMGNRGLIVAVERKKSRVRPLVSNINRLGALNVVVLNMDSRELVNYDLRFSKVLLDAPCSGEGIIPRDPTRKSKTQPEELYQFSMAQLELMDTAYRLLKEKGELVYSTCSIAPEEDEFVVNYAVEELGMEVIPTEGYPASKGIISFNGVDFSREVENCIRFYPHKHKTEGFFVCHLRKR